MQNTHDQDAVVRLLIENNMRLMLEPSQAPSELLSAPSHLWIDGELRETGLKLLTITTSTFDPDTFNRELCDRLEVDRGTARKSVISHWRR